MDKSEATQVIGSQSIALGNQQHKVLRNAYLALAMTFGISAIMSTLVLTGFISPPVFLASPISVLLMTIGFIFGIHLFKNSTVGFILLLAFGGTLGITLAPAMMHYAQKAPQLVTNALFATVILFCTLSMIATRSKTNFTKWYGFLSVGLLVMIGLSLVGYYTSIPISQTIISGLVLLIVSGMTLADTQHALRDPKANYLTVAVSLFLNIINIFLSLLQIFSNE